MGSLTTEIKKLRRKCRCFVLLCCLPSAATLLLLLPALVLQPAGFQPAVLRLPLCSLVARRLHPKGHRGRREREVSSHGSPTSLEPMLSSQCCHHLTSLVVTARNLPPALLSSLCR